MEYNFKNLWLYDTPATLYFATNMLQLKKEEKWKERKCKKPERR